MFKKFVVFVVIHHTENEMFSKREYCSQIREFILNCAFSIILLLFDLPCTKKNVGYAYALSEPIKKIGTSYLKNAQK